MRLIETFDRSECFRLLFLWRH